MRDEVFELKRQLNSAISLAVPYGLRTFSSERAKTIEDSLKVPLKREDVSTRLGGGRQEIIYLETHKAIDLARDIFGDDLAIEIRGEPAVLLENTANGRKTTCVRSIVRVTLANGCFHEDVGVSSSNLTDPVEAIKVATKASVSDGIKRALQHFGPALGSCLRDKRYQQKRSKSTEEQNKRLKSADQSDLEVLKAWEITMALRK